MAHSVSLPAVLTSRTSIAPAPQSLAILLALRIRSTCHIKGSRIYGLICIQTVDALRVEHLVGLLDSGSADGARRLAHLVRTRLAHAHVEARQDDVVLGRVEA